MKTSMANPVHLRTALQANWVQPKKVERWLGSVSLGRTLNVCCGMSKVGDVRLDTDPNTNRTQEGDLFRLSYPPRSFDTVICDPPYSYYNKFAWLLKLSDIADKRLILASNTVNLRRTFGNRQWRIRLFSVGDGQTMFVKLYWILDRKNESLEAVESQP